jgi:hypothetical protein
LDIIVTTPKSEHETAQLEGESVRDDPDAYWFRTFKFKPKINVGERVYYVDLGRITGYGIVFAVEQGKLEDDAHGMTWTGWHVKQREWVPLKRQILMRGFQGLRYVQGELQKQLREAEK